VLHEPQGLGEGDRRLPATRREVPDRAAHRRRLLLRSARSAEPRAVQ
jgi:hypothetical protein